MISCQLHDYIEIACMYRYLIRISLLDGTELQGKAKTTNTNADKKEVLVVSLEHEDIEIELNQIKELRAVTANPYFEMVKF